jgi:hypothetical protein
MKTRMPVTHNMDSVIRRLFMIAGVVVVYVLFSAQAVFCEGAPLPAQANYANDLETKQESLVSIKEDTEKIESALICRVKISEGIKQVNDQRLRGLESTGQSLMEIMPPASRINLESCRMSGTISPQSNPGIIKSHSDGN